MSAIDHRTKIIKEQGVVRTKVAKGEYVNESKTIYQAHCQCGYKGPRRTSVWEANEDCDFHTEHPEESA